MNPTDSSALRAPPSAPADLASAPPDSIPVAEPLLRSPLDERPYQCPTERRPISAAVHYQRLLSGYDACRGCPHRHAAGSLAPESLRRALAGPPPDRSLFGTNGIRGVVPNDLSTEVLQQLGRAIGETLWSGSLPDQTADRAAPDRETAAAPPIRKRPPTVILGHDHRAVSPRLCREIVLGIRESGTHVLEAGRLPRAVLQFAVEHWRVDAAVSVTGAGAPHSWGGIDLLGPGGQTWSRGGRLDAVEHAFRRPATRRSRSGGHHQSIDPLPPYAASLQRHLHGQRPLQAAFTASDRVLAGLIETLFAATPLRMTFCPDDQLETALRRGEFDLGLRFSEDGSFVEPLDECGEPLPMLALVAHLAEAMLSEWSHVAVAVADELLPGENLTMQTRSGAYVLFHPGGTTQEALVATMRESGAQLGLDLEGRVWIGDPEIACDGVGTAVQILKLMSQRAEPASWLRHVPGLALPSSLSETGAGR